jgi:serine/threonine protein kinase
MQDDRVKAALEPDGDYVLGDYVLGDVLGTGGMGIIYSAIQRSLDRRVAIKIPHPELASDPFVNRRFRAEARASGRLDHRNIARVIDFGGRDGALFLVMQHVAGVPLEKLVLAHGPMETHIAADLCGQILAALDATHTAGIIHADIKSSNVLVETMADGALRAVVIDFGLAHFCDEPTSPDALLLSGTPGYLAPELIRGGPPTVASDIYAAGVVLYELLTGTTPFGGGTSAEIFDRQLGDAVIPPSLRSPDRDIPRALEAIVMRALAKDPSTRFTSAAQFGAALRAATPGVLAQPPRLAHGTRHGIQTSGFSTDTTTHDWQRERIPGAAAVTAGDHTCIQQLLAIVKAAP